MPMLVSYDPQVGATYIELSDVDVARTVSVTDLVMIDVDADGQAIGVEFAVAPARITDDMLYAVAHMYPWFKDLINDRSWLLVSS